MKELKEGENNLRGNLERQRANMGVQEFEVWKLEKGF